MFGLTLFDVINFAVMWSIGLFGIFATRPNSKLMFKNPCQDKLKRRLHITLIILFAISVCAIIASVIMGALGYE